jgi:hypothetical protein
MAQEAHSFLEDVRPVLSGGLVAAALCVECGDNAARAGTVGPGLYGRLGIQYRRRVGIDFDLACGTLLIQNFWRLGGTVIATFLPWLTLGVGVAWGGFNSTAGPVGYDNHGSYLAETIRIDVAPWATRWRTGMTLSLAVDLGKLLTSPTGGFVTTPVTNLLGGGLFAMFGYSF